MQKYNWLDNSIVEKKNRFKWIDKKSMPGRDGEYFIKCAVGPDDFFDPPFEKIILARWESKQERFHTRYLVFYKDKSYKCGITDMHIKTWSRVMRKQED